MIILDTPCAAGARSDGLRSSTPKELGGTCLARHNVSSKFGLERVSQRAWNRDEIKSIVF